MTKNEIYLRWKNKDPERYAESVRKGRIRNGTLLALFRHDLNRRLRRFLFRDKTLRNDKLNRDKNREYKLRYYQQNKKFVLLRCSEYKKSNKGRVAATNAARKILKLMAFPKWVNRQDIVAIYAESQRKSLLTNIPHVVDHIWPLQGKGFVGLHVPWNLRVITNVENIRKHNHRPDKLGICR